MTTLRLFLYLAGVTACIHVLPVWSANPRKTTTTDNPAGIPEPSDPLNAYCKYSVYDRTDAVYHLIDIVCKNDNKSELKENFYISENILNTYFQADNGAMSRAVEDAIQQMKTKFPQGTRQIRVNVNALHPLGGTRFYGRLVAMIDISNKLATELSGDDYVQLTVSHAGLRVDPQFDADRVKVVPQNGVVLVNWNYKKRATSSLN